MNIQFYRGQSGQPPRTPLRFSEPRLDVRVAHTQYTNTFVDSNSHTVLVLRTLLAVL